MLISMLQRKRFNYFATLMTMYLMILKTSRQFNLQKKAHIISIYANTKVSFFIILFATPGIASYLNFTFREEGFF